MIENPFGDAPVHEVHLPRAPLVHVVSQFRFPKNLALSTEEGVAPLQAALRSEYPGLQQEKAMAVLLSAEGVTAQPEGEVVWRLSTRGGGWQVSVSSGFISLSTSEYESRSDFLQRLRAVLEALGAAAQPAWIERIGVRYIDRIDQPEHFARLHDFVRPELLGGLAVPLPDGVSLAHSASEAVFTQQHNQLFARWGVFAAGTTLDPSLVPPSDSQSWILDIDAASGGQVDFDPEALTATAAEFADQVYRFFRWAVTDELLREAGGEL